MVYVVFCGHEYEVERIFATRTLADDYVFQQTILNNGPYHIEEIEVLGVLPHEPGLPAAKLNAVYE